MRQWPTQQEQADSIVALGKSSYEQIIELYRTWGSIHQNTKDMHGILDTIIAKHIPKIQ